MPQMSPMMWEILFLLILMMMFTASSKFYFFFFTSSLNFNLEKLNKVNKIWKW